MWFTVGGGVLSDVYYPTIESSNAKTLQYIVTDGKTFADLQQRDMTYAVSSPDRSGMVCRVMSTDARHGFQIVTDYLTDPARASVVMRSRLVPFHGGGRSFGALKVYVRYHAHIDNTGGGGSPTAAPTPRSPTQPRRPSWQPIHTGPAAPGRSPQRYTVRW